MAATQDLLRENLGLVADEFNIEPTAGIHTASRLDAMLDQAGIAFLVMTAEAPRSDDTYMRARMSFMKRERFRGGLVGNEQSCCCRTDVGFLQDPPPLATSKSPT